MKSKCRATSKIDSRLRGITLSVLLLVLIITVTLRVKMRGNIRRYQYLRRQERTSSGLQNVGKDDKANNF